MADEDKKSELTGSHPDIHEKTLVGVSAHGDEITPSPEKLSPPYLVVVDGPRVGTRFSLGQGGHVLGRSSAANVRLEDQSVSRQHSELFVEGSSFQVKDLGSKNGTLVNGRLIHESVMIGHKDLVKVGIYLLRLVTQEISTEEEMTLPADYIMVDRTVFAQAEPDGETASVMKKVENLQREAKEKSKEEKKTQKAEKKKMSPRTKREKIFLAVGILCVVLALGFFLKPYLFNGKKEKELPNKKAAVLQPEKTETPAESAKNILPEETSSEQNADAPESSPESQTALEGASPEATPLDASSETKTLSPATGTTQSNTLPVFLDFASSPISAEVTFQGKILGRTPLRINLELEPDKTYTATADFVLPEIKEQFTQDLEFTVSKDKSVIPLLFRGPIGMIRVDNLPRDVQFYLEGSFDYDRFNQRSAKLDEIVLQKPIYVPYGNYIIELRRARRLSESSETFVQDIIYRREVKLQTENPSYVMAVSDEDLSVFPAAIRSFPENADVFVDGSKVGVTPYNGMLPLGEHQMTLRKEGYFEHTEALKVDINTPYATEVKLKTSLSGAHINNAKAALSRKMYQQAVNELAEALASTPSSSEEGLAQYMLGKAYLGTGDLERALGYFEKAKTDEGNRYPAMLGIVNVYAIQGKTNESLPLLVEVMLKAQDETVKQEANDLFQKISPFKSVLYIHSEPEGAKVVVNDKSVAQQTPVILHELPLGNYRIRIEQEGYLPTDLNLNLTVNEFNPVVVKLKPIPQ